jgi:hypothetical protein
MPNVGENLALLSDGSNSDSVPATVSGSELVRLTRQRLNMGSHPQQSGAHRNATSVSQVAPDRRGGLGRAHPYHESCTHRCTELRLCRSPPTVDRRVMCSTSAVAICVPISIVRRGDSGDDHYQLDLRSIEVLSSLR